MFLCSAVQIALNKWKGVYGSVHVNEGTQSDLCNIFITFLYYIFTIVGERVKSLLVA